MSYIRFTPIERGGLEFRISGAEQAHVVHVLQYAVSPVPAIVRWLADVDVYGGGFVRSEQCFDFARAIRTACETTVRMLDASGGGEFSVSALRVGMSNCGRADLNRRGDRGESYDQTWWSLTEWFSRGPGDVVVSYSVNPYPWELDGVSSEPHRLRSWCHANVAAWTGAEHG